jgi:hypothetical protein
MSKKPVSTAFASEEEKKADKYLTLVKGHNGRKTDDIIVSQQKHLQTTLTHKDEMHQQHTQTTKTLPLIMGIFIVTLAVFGIAFPDYFIYGVLFAPLVLVMVIKSNRTPKQIVTSTAKVSTKVTKTLLVPGQKGPTEWASITYCGKIIATLLVINVGCWYLLDALFSASTTYIYLSMAIVSLITLQKLQPKRPTRHLLYVLLYSIKLGAITLFADLLIWSISQLIYAPLFSKILLPMVYSGAVYAVMGICTVFVLLSWKISLRSVANENLSVALLTINTLLCGYFYYEKLVFFLPALALLLALYYVFFSKIIVNIFNGDKIGQISS